MPSATPDGTAHVRISAMAALCALAACSAAGTIAGPLAPGVWGGAQGNLTVYADSATLDLPCAAGRIQGQVVAAADGTFELSGVYAAVVGPVQVGGPQWQPAQFDGSRTDDNVSLSIALASGATVGPLRFHRGTTGQFARCL